MITVDPEVMLKLALLFKFPSIKVVEFPLTAISPLLVIVRLFGLKVQVHDPCWRTHETFPCVKSNKGASEEQKEQFAT